MDELFDRLAAAEDAFFTSQFLSPVLRGRPIRIRICNIVVFLNVTKPKDFEGWGVFQPKDYENAAFVREPRREERQAYLELFPTLRLIACRRTDNGWLGIPAGASDGRFKVTGLVPIALAREIQMFEVVQTRFDGSNCWFEDVATNHNPRTAVYLRESLNKLMEPDAIGMSGLTQEEKDAYVLAYGPAIAADLEAKRDKQEERIKEVLLKAGARYQGYIERGDTYTVEYTVGREHHRSVVRKGNLEVQSAGICLSGGDKAFDLQSLVGVIREGIRRRKIVRVGDNVNQDNDYDEDDY